MFIPPYHVGLIEFISPRPASTSEIAFALQFIPWFHNESDWHDLWFIFFVEPSLNIFESDIKINTDIFLKIQVLE
ncbi:hypothetical protein CLW00_11726 [Mongoliibacter ruber]|uniref:Uncharacterized protein n=1 Tax=Mongoliibacter ruber TaxID=1750599 RepID=A0A2T0WDG4_9BACT|nr:hypothetical protein CLW00_11726 [Mongoliibacter ruber]